LQKALSSKNITARFNKTGIWPFNPEAVRNQTAPSTGFGEGQPGFNPEQVGYDSGDNSDASAAEADEGTVGADLGEEGADRGEDDEGDGAQGGGPLPRHLLTTLLMSPTLKKAHMRKPTSMCRSTQL
jgi:hypothetical protein